MKQENQETEQLGEIKLIIEKVKVEGNGCILITGPSSCGKGEIAKALCRFLSLPELRHLSMGEILRNALDRSKKDTGFRQILAETYNISEKKNIYDIRYNRIEIVEKAEQYAAELSCYFGKTFNKISQLDWLEFCVRQGLLVPDEWTVSLLDAMLYNTPELQQGIFILDGYPRTEKAAEYLLETMKSLRIPIIKVLHLFITKEQMKARAKFRNRQDDEDESLERRYQFYIEKVQPCIDFLKVRLGSSVVSLIDAHQPIIREDGTLDKNASIMEVVYSVLQALGLPRYLTEIH
ncbi:MAG: nucleoside monophosphate kinase [Bacillota bacterium]